MQILELNSRSDNIFPFPPRHIRMVGHDGVVEIFNSFDKKRIKRLKKKPRHIRMMSHDGVVEDEVESETKQSQQEKKRKEKPGGDNNDQFN